MLSPRSRASALIAATFAAVMLIGSAPPTSAAGAIPTEAQQIVAIARAQLGDPYRFGADGPSSFDCSGLVIYAFVRAGDGEVIRADSIRSARGMYLNFKSRGLASRSNPKVGDLVVWGSGSHIGIYIGDGKAISALTRGVSIHSVSSFSSPFTAYLHTGMSIKPSSVAPAVVVPTKPQALVSGGPARVVSP
jgi:cell wall-associated NlpC family hydrolase